ncbi:MAG: hypothetical protein D3926_20440 [Desulfobacteraceae bacterium]|nr:MAG: hypothetical protein D3926_20440 [Desulfobacteraceae bacterium]
MSLRLWKKPAGWAVVALWIFLWTGMTWAANPGTLNWRYDTGDDVRASATIGSDGTIYIGSYSDYLYAMNPDGTLKWRFLAGGNFFSSAAIAPDGTIYCGNHDSNLYAINPNGSLKWSYTAGGWVSSSPVIGSDGTIYVGSDDTYFYAITSSGTRKWRYQTGDEVNSSPALGEDGTIYFGSDDTYIYALNANGTLKWRYKTLDEVWGSPVVGQDGTIFCGSEDGYLYALNPDGSLKWKYLTGGEIDYRPAIGLDGTIYVGSDDNFLYALNPNGTRKWRYQTGGDLNIVPVIGPDGTIFFGSSDDYFYALNPNGTLKWRYLTDGNVINQAAIGSDGTVFFGSYDGYIYAVNEDSHYFIPLYKATSAYWSGMGITNRSKTQTADVSVAIYNRSGVLQSTETKAIPAGGQTAFVIGAGAPQDGWVKLTSDEPLAGMNFAAEYIGATKDYFLSDVPFTGWLSNRLLIPHVAQWANWDTTVFVANGGAASALVTFTYTDKSGVASKPYTTTIPSMGSREISVALIAGSSNVKGGYITIEGNGGLTAFAQYNNLKTGNYSYAGINADNLLVPQTSYRYAIPVFKPRPGHWSGFGIANQGSSTASVTAEVYNKVGAKLETVTKTIPANGQTSFVIGGSLASSGWVLITSNQPLSGLNFMGEYDGASTNYFLADVPFSSVLSTLLLIPHVAQWTNWDTTVFVANPNSASAKVSLTYTDKSGLSSAAYTTTIGANGSAEVSVATIAGSNTVKGGYVTISSSRGVTAFALYDNLKTGNYSFAGINAENIEK